MATATATRGPSIKRLEKGRDRLKAKIAKLKGELGELGPQLVEINQQIKSTKAKGDESE